jgi:fluoroquinolone transport system ATP-binding protein
LGISLYYERVRVSFELPNHYLKLTALENLEYFRSLYAGETEMPRRLLYLVELRLTERNGSLKFAGE